MAKVESTEFTLCITLGNDAMQTGADVAAALRQVAARLEEGALFGRVRDENGNSVGRWELS